MTDIRDRLDDDEFRRLGLYVEQSDLTMIDGPTGPVEVLVVECQIGDVAFTDRVIDPEKDATDRMFDEFAKASLDDDFLDAHQQIARNIAAGRDPLDDGDDE